MKIPVDHQSRKRMPNLQKVHNTNKEHFQNHSNDNSHESIENTSHIFHNKITNGEVKKNIMKLNQEHQVLIKY